MLTTMKADWCPKCDYPVLPKFKFTEDKQLIVTLIGYCSWCGTKLVEQPNTDIVCSCGAESSKSSRYCQVCGLRLKKRSWLSKLFGGK